MSGLPLAAIGAHPLLAQQQQQLAARAAAAGGPGGPQHRNAAAVAAAAAAAAAAADANRRQLAGKKRKALEKPAAEKTLHLIPEAPLFNSLAMQAHYVDDLIKRQRLELQAAANPLECPVHKRLRVYIFNTHSHQQQDTAAAGGSRSAQHDAGGSSASSSSSSSSSSDPPQWTLVVWGRLENPDPPAVPKASSSSAPTAAAAATGAGGAAATGAADGAAARGPDAPSAAAAAAAAAGGGGEPAAAAAPPLNVSALAPQPVSQHSTQHKHPCSGFFKRIQFKFDPDPSQPADSPDAALSCVTWEKLQHRGPHKDRLEVKRVGSQPTKVTITFEQDFAPPVFKVDKRLAEVLCMTFGQQQMVMTRLYSYIVNATPQPDLTNLQLDDKLEPIFGTKQLSTAALPQALGRLLEPLKPITVTHNIVTSGPSPGPATCIDFDVLLPVKLQEKIAPAVDPLLEDKQGEVLDTKIDASLAKLYESRRRRDIYLGFAEDPVGFINTIIASHARELRVSRNNQAVAIERRTDMFREKWVDEAALRYLGRKAKQEALFPSAPGQGLGGS